MKRKKKTTTNGILIKTESEGEHTNNIAIPDLEDSNSMENGFDQEEGSNSFLETSHMKNTIFVNSEKELEGFEGSQKMFPLVMNDDDSSIENKKEFQCDECEKSFNAKANLQRHKSRHLGWKPFSCDECDKCFSEKGNLVRHKIIHKGLKPFSCSKCSKSFSEQGNLQKHQLKHTGIRYFCEQCPKSFNDRSNLYRHVKNVHNEFNNELIPEIQYDEDLTDGP